MRMYEPVWIALKKHKHVTIRVPPHLHARVIKAVIKEKWLDMPFKKREGWRKMYLTYSIFENEITFSLNYRLNEIVAKDF